jgi:three-Cys-motif partner protein
MAQANIPELRLTLVDGFCGGGCYQTEEGDLTDGSPLLMMRAVRDARALLNLDRRIPRKINVHYEFIDILPDTTKHLRHWLDARRQENAIDLSDYEQAQVINKDFLQDLPNIINKVKQRKMGNTSFLFLTNIAIKIYLCRK